MVLRLLLALQHTHCTACCCNLKSLLKQPRSRYLQAKRSNSDLTAGGSSFCPTAILREKMVFVKASEFNPQMLGLRSFNKLKPAHGVLYMGIHYDQSHLYLVLGTTDKPIVTPKGITVNEDPKGAWASLSAVMDDCIEAAIDGVDDRMRQLLADNSATLFGVKCTPEMITKYKLYTPLAYSKEDSNLAPLAGGKVVLGTILEHMIGCNHQSTCHYAQSSRGSAYTARSG